MLSVHCGEHYLANIYTVVFLPVVCALLAQGPPIPSIIDLKQHQNEKVARGKVNELPWALNHEWLNCLYSRAPTFSNPTQSSLGPKPTKFIWILFEAKYLPWDDLAVKVMAEDL